MPISLEKADQRRIRYIKQLKRVLEGQLFKNPEETPVVFNANGDTVLILSDVKKTLETTLKYLEDLKKSDLLDLFENGAKIDKADITDSTMSRSSVLPSNISDNLVIKILTNTKLYDGNKNTQGFLGKGASKTFKNCVELKFNDNNDLLYMSDMHAKGSIILGPEDNPTLCESELKNLKRDVEISHRYGNNDYIAPLSLGPQYKKIDKNSSVINKAVYVFSELAVSNFAEIEYCLTQEELKQVNADKINGIMPQLYIKLFSDVLKGLAAMHEHGDVHCDIKGGNILIYRAENGDLSAKITDFGNTVLKEDADRSLKESTYEHCAPELMKTGFYDTNRNRSLGAAIYNQNKDFYKEHPIANPKIDMWALGITMAQLLIGEYPGEHSYQKQQDIIESKLKLIKKNNPLIAKLLDPNPQNRPTAQQALELLQNSLKDHNEQSIVLPHSEKQLTFNFDAKQVAQQVEARLDKILSKSFEEIVDSFIKNYTSAEDLKEEHDKIHDYEIYKNISTRLVSHLEGKDLIDLSEKSRKKLFNLCDEHSSDLSLETLRSALKKAQNMYDML